MTLGQTIRALRKKRGLTQAQLGSLCGLTGAMVSGYERGESFPRKKTLDALAEALEVEVSRLTEAPAPLPAEPRWERSTALLLEGLLGVLEARHGFVERKAIGEAGYYVVGLSPESFILHERDLLAMASAAKASALPLLESVRRRQAVPEGLRKLG